VARVDLAAELEVEIAATSGRFSAALTSGDGPGASAVYVEDAVLLPPAGDAISGRDAIARFWQGGIEIGLHAVELDALGRGGVGPVLYEHGRYRMRFAPTGGRLRVERGPYILVHVRTGPDGSWQWGVAALGSSGVKRDH
jgi:ketosteroid isomerase-like protein